MIQQQNPQAQQPTPEPDVEPAASRYRFKHRGAKLDWDIGMADMLTNPDFVEAQRQGRFEMQPLYAHPPALHRQMDDMALLMRQLVQSLNKAAPGHERAKAALDYLRLQGNPLRTTTQEQST